MTTTVTVRVGGEYRATVNIKSPPGTRTQTTVLDGDREKERSFSLTHEAGADIEVREVPLTDDMKKARGDADQRQPAERRDGERSE